MPLYQTRCSVCRKVDSVFRKIAERDDLPACACGGVVAREIVAPAFHASFTPYESPITGKMIESKTQQREDLAASGCVLNEPGLKQEIERTRQALIAQDEAKLDKAVDEVVCALNVSGRI